jgi:hypothetical protein
MNKKMNPMPFSYWYFFSLFRDNQSKIKWISNMRKTLQKRIVAISILSFFSVFSNFALYILLIILGTIGFIETCLIIYAFIKGNVRFFKRKIKRESIWK